MPSYLVVGERFKNLKFIKLKMRGWRVGMESLKPWMRGMKKVSANPWGKAEGARGEIARGPETLLGMGMVRGWEERAVSG